MVCSDVIGLTVEKAEFILAAESYQVVAKVLTKPPKEVNFYGPGIVVRCDHLDRKNVRLIYAFHYYTGNGKEG